MSVSCMHDMLAGRGDACSAYLSQPAVKTLLHIPRGSCKKHYNSEGKVSMFSLGNVNSELKHDAYNKTCLQLAPVSLKL